jgi:uncharacterized protein YndB with AHSA1/START domain
MEIIGFLLVLLILAAGGLIAFAARKPDTFRVARGMIIGAPPQAIFSHLDDLEAWQAWSPWAKKDPNAKTTFGAIRAGRGASFGWDGDRNIGKGMMSIVESEPPARIAYQLDFERPFKARNIATFTLRPVTGGTEVIWSMHGPAPLISKVMDTLMNMDRMIGRDFEAGLASLKAIVEKR